MTEVTGMEKKLGIYSHIPFCRIKCEYCDIYSLGGVRNKDAMDRYLQELYEQKKITKDTLLDYCDNPEALLKRIR